MRGLGENMYNGLVKNGESIEYMKSRLNYYSFKKLIIFIECI